MRADIQIIISEIDKSLSLLRQRLDWDNVRKKREEFDALTEDPDLWNEPDKAQKLMRERQNFIDRVDAHDAMSTELKENIELIELAEVEADEEILQEVLTALQLLKNRASAKELEALLNGEADGNDTFLEIHAGAGGTESCDWAGMISRMYVRWAERSGYKVELQSETAGDEAGLKSVSYKISGQNAYGWLKTESGVHRLVRISPFDSGARRHTSFASVWVYPVIDDSIKIEILEKQNRGTSNEIQLTDAIASRIGASNCVGYKFSEERFDCGSKLGFIQANIRFSIERPEMKQNLKSWLKREIVSEY